MNTNVGLLECLASLHSQNSVELKKKGVFCFNFSRPTRWNELLEQTKSEHGYNRAGRIKKDRSSCERKSEDLFLFRHRDTPAT